MYLTGSAKAVRVLKELVGMWDKVRIGVSSLRSIRGTGLAQVKQSPDGITIHVAPPAPPPEERGRGLIGKWVKLVDYSDDGSERNYSGDLYASIDGPAAAVSGIAVRNGAEVGHSDEVAPLTMGRWHVIVDAKEIDGTLYAIIEASSGSSISRMKVQSVPSGQDYITAKTWDGTTLGSTAVRVIPVMGHAVNDIIYAAQSSNGTEVTDTDWVEVLICDPTTDRYKVMQAIDTTGRLGMDWVRAH